MSENLHLFRVKCQPQCDIFRCRSFEVCLSGINLRRTGQNRLEQSSDGLQFHKHDKLNHDQSKASQTWGELRVLCMWANGRHLLNEWRTECSVDFLVIRPLSTFRTKSDTMLKVARPNYCALLLRTRKEEKTKPARPPRSLTWKS